PLHICCLLLRLPPTPPRSTLFPYTTLFRSYNVSISDTSKRGEGIARIEGFVVFVPGTRQGQNVRIRVTQVSERFASVQVVQSSEDRKSTRLNSSHGSISYAVFCLKKKQHES